MRKGSRIVKPTKLRTEKERSCTWQTKRSFTKRQIKITEKPLQRSFLERCQVLIKEGVEKLMKRNLPLL
ncbi:hypothetical protein NC652_031832 [Populus alba x Populus x berolinensis]|nr:hypothetical protein NC652_031832 [Populus alba x Populus x berolinensis]